MTTENPTRREQIVKALVTNLKTMQDLTPASGAFSVRYSDVYREPPKTLTRSKLAVAVVLEGLGSKNDLNLGVVECTLDVTLEFHCAKPTPNQDMSELLNEYLGETDRLIRSDRTLGGLCTDIKIIGDEISPEGIFEVHGAGMLKIQIRYRHATSDPRQITGE